MKEVEIRGQIHLTSDPAIKIFDNSTAVLIRPDVPDWIRTSTVGIWILDLLRNGPITSEDVISNVMRHYNLPEQAVQKPTLLFLESLINNGYASVSTESGAQFDGKDATSSPQSNTDTHEINAPMGLEDLKPQQLWLHITSACNQRCKYCYYRVEKPGTEMDLEASKRLFEEAAKIGITQVVLSGGEPMLYSRILDIVQTCREASDWHIKLISNGTLPPGGTDDFLKIADQIDDLQISIDSVDLAVHDGIRGKGSFARATNAFVLLYENEAKVRRGISFTPLPENLDQIEHLNKLGYELHADYLHLNQPKYPADLDSIPDLKKNGFLAEEFMRKAQLNFRKLHIKLITDNNDARGLEFKPLDIDASFTYASALVKIQRLENCGAGITQLGLNPDFSAYPCAALTGREECLLGKYPEQSLFQLGRDWNKSIFSVERDPECSKCMYRYFCGGGCRAIADTPSNKDRFCEAIKYSYEEFFQFVSRIDPHAFD